MSLSHPGQSTTRRRLALWLALPGTLAAVLGWANLTALQEPLPAKARADHVLVEKSQRTLTLYFQGEPLKRYRIALGGNPDGHKRQEGDQRTPEGIYRIDFRKADSAYHRALHISYPNATDSADAKARGVEPGGAIMVHGMRNGFGWIGALHRFGDWSAGCIAVTDAEIEEIWRAVPDGTPIEIRP